MDKRLLSMRTKGFTLVELLVVMVIIAVLAALVMGGFSKSKETTNAMKCAANLKQIGVAMASYCADHDGRLPGPLLEEQHNTPAALAGAKSLGGMLKDYLGIQTVGAKTNTGTFTCPSWEQYDRSGSTAVFVVNVSARLTELNNQLPWGDNSTPPARLAALSDWQADLTDGPISSTRVWALRDATREGASKKEPSPHGDFYNALFFDFHVGQLNLKLQPK